MKNIKSILLAVLCLTVLSCNKHKEEEAYLEVNRNNISGCWSLSSWNGQVLAEGSHF